jgi:hypothetical protein
MAAFYLVAGIVHLIAPDKFLPIVPDFVPLPSEVVLATGVCEIVGGLALLTRRLRWVAGVMLALYAVLSRDPHGLRARVGQSLDRPLIGGLPRRPAGLSRVADSPSSPT